MLRVTRAQIAQFDAIARRSYLTDLANWLRTQRGAYVDDLTDDELAQVCTAIVAECDGLGLTGDDAVQAFAAAAVVYGVHAHRDPLFDTIFYADLPRGTARLPRGAAGIRDALGDVLDQEFSTRSGTELVAALWQSFGMGDWPDMQAPQLLATYFPERAARLDADRISRHLALSEAEADRLGLQDARARRVQRDVGLLLGARFATDPLYPWAVAAFQGGTDDRSRVSRLRAALKLIAERAIAQLEGRG